MNRTVAGTFPCCVLLLVLSLIAHDPAAAAGFRPIALELAPIDSFAKGLPETHFGTLEFRGGLVVDSDDPDFGALSGLDFMPDGSLLAVADTGFWFSARPIEENGRLTGLAEARLGPILASDGSEVGGKRQGDAESLRVVARQGRVDAFVAFERRNDVRRFAALPDISLSRPAAVAVPKAISGLRGNASLEAMAIAPADGVLRGALVLLAERSLDEAGNHRGWIVGGRRAGGFSVLRSGEFDITDAAFLEGGDLLVLERRFNFTAGPGVRIRRIAAADLIPGQTVDGRVLLEADLRHRIDNMEGMALARGQDGETLITLVSDDNHNILQRTILLRFALPPDAIPLPRPRPQS